MIKKELKQENIIIKTSDALKANGFDVYIARNGTEAEKKVLGLLPDGAEVMNMTSATLDKIGVSADIESSGKYVPIRKKLMSLDRNTQGSEMRKLGSAPEWSIGSVHALTQDGKVMIASATGSQLPAYSYGAEKVIWVVGKQKIVENVEEGFKRIYEYALPLESERARKAYGVQGSSVNKLLIVNKEHIPGRITIIIVNEELGF